MKPIHINRIIFNFDKVNPELSNLITPRNTTHPGEICIRYEQRPSLLAISGVIAHAVYVGLKGTITASVLYNC